MKRRLLVSILFALVATGGAHAASFDYHGSLQDAGKPAEGSYDIELTLYSAADGGRVTGGPLTLYKVPVHAGAFDTQADFGPLTKLDQGWLGVKVRSAGSGEFAALSARSPVTAASSASVCPGAWTLGGNAGNPAGSYLGTADNLPLVFKISGVQAGQLQATTPSGGFSDAPNVIFGSSSNSLSPGVIAATISGGGVRNGSSSLPNSVTGNYGTVSGGNKNTSADFSTVGGGDSNTASGTAATIGGGESNTASVSYYATVGGGNANTASANYATVGGGGSNTASYQDATISGGYNNQATQTNATVSGGGANVASGVGATVAGGAQNTAGGDYSFAAGKWAHVRSAADIGGGNTGGDQGTFVWSDSTSYISNQFTSTGPNQFLVRATGGVGINTTPHNSSIELTITGNSASNPTADLTLLPFGLNVGFDIAADGNLGFGVYQTDGATYTNSLYLDHSNNLTITGANAYKPGGGAWSAPSDARLKREVQSLAHMLDRLLQLRGVTFEYKQPDAGLHPAGRHTGFIAQEVQEVFPEWVGQTPDGYLSVGPTGFEAMTVEALRELRAEKDDEIAGLHDENTQLHAQLDDVLARLKKLEAGQGN